MPNYRLDLSFDGSRYRGWQRLKGRDDSIQGKLEQTLSRICGEEIQLIGCGRTDAGVHAEQYVANFHSSGSGPSASLAAEAIRSELDRYLPEDIVVLDLQTCPERFHARFHARSKLYSYRIDRGRRASPFGLRYRYHCSEALDLDAMRQAATLLCGEHDFRSFTTQRDQGKSLRRTILSVELKCIELSSIDVDSCELREKPSELWLQIEGDGFLWNMVRIMAGALLDCGRGQLRLEDLQRCLNSTERQQAAAMLPAKGLFLQRLRY